ncbi:MAG: MarR family transcriptional regulator [Bosea sp.]|nr:MarR family transcriptional regulator [Bosea sp. (in: a-proteobacteria)]
MLALLTGRPAGLRPKEIAAHLAVSAASIADTLSALERKGLLERSPDPGDARAVIARPTQEGRGIGRRVAGAASTIAVALAELTPAEQADLLLTQIKLIRTLQRAGAIPMQRMCVSCRHFRPNAHPGASRPHHCAFVDAAIGERDLRLDCGEHEAAEPAVQSANWAAFEAPGRAVPPS